MTCLIDWRSWLMSALARRLGFTVQHVGLNPKTGARAFVLGTTEQCCADIAENVFIQHRVELARHERMMAGIDKAIESMSKRPARNADRVTH